ncbi:DNA polymerase I [Roseinatronobacter monicus]|uniref:DNA polymerase I n=1 Tax=Roseinatronobacter monicus TaxID=393481 RepID=A0A543KBS3_9RHOB|nr:DNA polymerase I [Roseinatronobacter monicus]TQM92514.1 DNA polymerase I [Roseinatronobacter monicus]
MSDSETGFGKGCHLHLIDGSAYIFRAYHALPPLARKSDGLPVGAVAGFCNMLWRYLGENGASADAPTHAAVIFDYSSKTFRNEIYDLYKANRPEPPEDLRPQFPLTRDASRAFNLATIEIEDFEADDIIATLARQAREAGGRVTIISSDKDLMQLVGGGVEMLEPMKNKLIGVEEVREKFGVGPERVADVQALAGDSVDNVPGAPGIGIKTAALLINEYGDLETLLARAEEIKQPKRRAALIDNADLIRISKRLVLLDDKTPLDFALDDLEVRAPDAQALLGFLNDMEFRTLTRRVAEHFGTEPPALPQSTATGQTETAEAKAPDHPDFDKADYICIRDLGTLKTWISEIEEIGYVAVDTETTSLDEMRAELVGISLCLTAGRAAYIPLQHRAGGGDLFGSTELVAGQLALDDVLALLKPVLEDQAILKIGQNMKYDAKIFANLGISVSPIDDTMLMSYALHGGLHGHGMDALSDRYLNHQPIPIKTLLGGGKSAITFDRVGIDDATRYAAEDADITLRLWELFKPRLHGAQVSRVYETLERPLVPVLAQMERTGIKVDRDILSRMSNAFAQKMAGLEAEIHELAGERFNVGSPKQLGEILFDKMSLQGGKKGKTGAYATGADVLEDLAAEGHDLPARVLDWRQLSKLKSTYTDALQDHIHPETGRVHTSYVITGAVTGRLASTDPNLQNIPIRSEEGRRIRTAFVAEKGHKLVALDYSQIELRILAHIADIDSLKAAFREGQDIHAMTASEMFGVPLAEMTPEIRRQAKAINFGVIYGISGFGLARNLRIPRSDAQAFIDTYFERFPGIRAYMDGTVEFAKREGRVETLFGRRVHTPEINTKGPGAGFAKRAAINAPIQGTAADIIRRAMIRLPEVIADLPAKMLLQVHDELVFEVAEDAVEEVTEKVRAVMEAASEPVLRLDVPLVVDAGVGDTWAEAH